MRGRSPSLRALLIWLPVLGLCTAVLWLFRDEVHEAHMALAYLLVVLGGSARSGGRVGTVLAILAFLTFNFFLLPPFYTLTIEDPLDWWILIAFLITGAVAAQLFHRAQSALETAERRAREIDRLSTIGAQSLAGPRAADAVENIARVIRSELRVPGVQIATVDAASGRPAVLAQDPDEGRATRNPELVLLASQEGCVVGIGADGTSQLVPDGRDLTWLLSDGRPRVGVMIPLRVHDRTVGVLHIHDRGGLRIDEQQAAFGDTLIYYAALAVERVRLETEAERVLALREADRLKDALLASVSHDLRTPLTTIRALGAEIRETGDERAAVIEEEAERLNRFVGDLLDLSRIRSGGMLLRPEIVAAEDLVGAALQRLRGDPDVDRVRVELPPGTRSWSHASTSYRPSGRSPTSSRTPSGTPAASRSISMPARTTDPWSCASWTGGRASQKRTRSASSSPSSGARTRGPKTTQAPDSGWPSPSASRRHKGGR